jgi:hypothetical protein
MILQSQDFEKPIKRFVLLNFIFTLIALAILFTPIKESLWAFNSISANLEMGRLKLFFYEPSYYSMVVFPFSFYLLLACARKTTIENLIYLFLSIIPLVLSFSTGVLSLYFLIVLFFLIRSGIQQLKKTRLKKRYLLVFSTFTIFTVVFVLSIWIEATNPIYIRLTNILAGEDTSGKGRIVDAFVLAPLIANQKSIWFGIGQGQLKIIGIEIIQAFYNYSNIQVADNNVAIPNVAAETLTLFGIIGLIIRVTLEFFLFIKTKTYQSSYRLGLFIFIFFYQFTGSFITNVVEYAIWCIAFTQTGLTQKNHEL